MKKLLFLLFASLLVLGACGSPDSEKLGTSDGKISEDDIDNVEEMDDEDLDYEDDEDVEDMTDLKTKEVNITKEIGNIKYTIHNIGKAKLNPEHENNVMTLDNEYKDGEKANILYAEIELENLSDEPTEYFIDQSEIITDTNEQAETSMSYLDGEIKSDMLGKVKSKGTIFWELKNTDINDVKKFELVAPAIFDDEFEEIHPEEKIELSFD